LLRPPPLRTGRASHPRIAAQASCILHQAKACEVRRDDWVGVRTQRVARQCSASRCCPSGPFTGVSLHLTCPSVSTLSQLLGQLTSPTSATFRCGSSNPIRQVIGFPVPFGCRRLLRETSLIRWGTGPLLRSAYRSHPGWVERTPTARSRSEGHSPGPLPRSALERRDRVGCPLCAGTLGVLCHGDRSKSPLPSAVQTMP
jgi:hypothetical protein